jgi:hypothetical protein
MLAGGVVPFIRNENKILVSVCITVYLSTIQSIARIAAKNTSRPKARGSQAT